MRNLAILIRKDLRCLLESQHALMAVFGFSLLLSVVESMVFRELGLTRERALGMTPGMLIVSCLFAGTVALRETATFERRHAPLEGFLLSGISPGILYLAKFFSNAAFLTVVFVFAAICQEVLFGTSFAGIRTSTILTVILFAFGFAAIGTFVSLLSLLTRAGEILFPLLLYPLLMPLVIGAAEYLRTVYVGGDLRDFWLQVMFGVSAVYLILSTTLFEFVIKE